MKGNTVRVEPTPEFATSTPASTRPRSYSARSLTGDETRRVLRMLDTLRTAGRNTVWNCPEVDEAKRASRIAGSMRSIACCDAAEILLAQGRAFLTAGGVADLHSDNEFHYWNVRLPVGDQSMVVYVPIPLREFPEVALRDREWADRRQFVANERAIQWNILDRAVRLDLLRAADEARNTIGPLRERSFSLRGTPHAETLLHELGEEISKLQAAIGRVPPGVNRTTLDAPVR